MPYIKREDRLKVDEQINELIESIVDEKSKAGLLNYSITRLIHGIYNLDNPSYEKINSAIGVLECAKQELYRKKAAPYEEEKILENGDV